MMNDVISVIIPVYNVENYLDKCLDSVVNQTYTNLEILIVDDGSTDSSSWICDRWAEMDNRIKVIHKKNGGVSDARNAGIDICKGKYLTFIDSDDYIERDYVEYLYELIRNYNADLSICELRMVTPRGKTINKVWNDGRVNIMSTVKAVSELCIQQAYSNSVWCKLYKTTAFREVRFPVGHIYEDIATTYKLFLKSSNIVFGRRALYNYLKRDRSITTSPFSMRKMDAIANTEQMCRDIESIWPEIESVTNYRRLVEYFSCWREIVLENDYSAYKNGIIYDIYTRVKVARKKISIRALPIKMKYYVFCSYFGRNAMRQAFRLEYSAIRIIKLR